MNVGRECEEEGSINSAATQSKSTSCRSVPQSTERRKPLKKRRIESPDSIIDADILPPTKLQRQVASCWYSNGVKAHEIGGRSNKIFRELTKSPPSSGPYSYDEHYATSTSDSSFSESKKGSLGKRRLSLIDDDDETEVTFASVECHAITLGSATKGEEANKTTISKKEPDPSTLILSRIDLEQELHMLTLQCCKSNAKAKPGSTIPVTPSPHPHWNSVSPTRVQSMPSPSLFSNFTDEVG